MSRDTVVRCDLCQQLIDTTTEPWVDAACYGQDYHFGCLTDDMKAIIRSLELSDIRVENVEVAEMGVSSRLALDRIIAAPVPEHWRG